MEQGLDALSQLRDIHAPDAVAFWPPAPGWWLLAAAVLAVMLIIAYHYRWRGSGGPHLRHDAQAELARIQREYQRDGDVTRMAAQLSILLRRIAVTWGGADVAGLSGEAWLRYLDEAGRTQAFSRGPGQALTTAPYQARAEVDAQALMATASSWIRHVTAQRPAGSPRLG